MDLNEAQRLQIRQLASQFVGSDSRVYALLRDQGPGSREIQILAEVTYALRDRWGSEKQLAARLGNPLTGFKTQVFLVDSKTPARMEHRRIRVMGQEL